MAIAEILDGLPFFHGSQRGQVVEAVLQEFLEGFDLPSLFYAEPGGVGFPRVVLRYISISSSTICLLGVLAKDTRSFPSDLLILPILMADNR